MKKFLVVLISVMLAAIMFVGCAAPAPTESASESASAPEESVAVESPSAEAPSESASESASAASGELSSEWSGLPAEVSVVDFGLDPAEVAAKGYTIGFAQCVMDHPYRIDMVDRAEKWCKEYGVEFIMMDGEGDTAKEVSNIESLIAKKVDAIVISSHGGVAITPALAQANQQNIPVILIDGGKPFADWNFVTWMSTDDFSLGEITGNLLVDDLGGEGKVAVLEGTSGSSCTEGRHEGFYSVIDQNVGINVVTEQDCNWLRKNAIDVVTNVLQANPDLKAVYAHNDEMALGAVEAVEAAGLKAGEDVLIYSAGDYQANCFEAIKAGKVRNTNIYKNDGDWACEAAIAYLMGKEVPHMINLGTRTCTIDNVDTETPAY